MPDRETVAVIGLGPSGLVALKNLLEAGFDAIGYDRNHYVGGLWKYSEGDQTSVLETTIVNISKERGCFTDFPFGKDISSYPSAKDLHKYLIGYTNHFELWPYVRVGVAVKHVKYHDQNQKWVLEIDGESNVSVDRVIIAIGGMTALPNIPIVRGIEQFKGVCIHARAFKRPAEFAGKRVMVVGFGNSAADTATQLVGIAGKIYLSHRHGARVLPRRIDGQPIDHRQSLRLFVISSLIARWFPNFSDYLFDSMLKRMQNTAFETRPEWGFEPAQRVPLVSDALVPCLKGGSVKSVKGIKQILNDSRVELEDKTIIDIDVIIWCTGYKSDFSIIDPRFDPTAHTTDGWSATSGSNGKSLARLYLNVFSIEKPHSLAFLGNVHLSIGGFQIFDMASMAIAQVWRGASALPSTLQMRGAVDDHFRWISERAQASHNISPGHVNAGPWVRAMDDLAGTGVNEYLGYGWRGWWFWFRERRLSNLLMGGLWTPHIHRLFPGKRKNWEGAKDAIIEVNHAINVSKRLSKVKQI